MIVADESARTLAVGLEDLLDAGERGAGGAAEEPRAASDARGEYLDRARDSGARVAEPFEVPLTWRDWTIHVSGRIDVEREDARGVSLELLRLLPDGDAELGNARALERAGFTALLLELGGRSVARLDRDLLRRDHAARLE